MKRILVVLIIVAMGGTILFFGRNFIVPPKNISGRLQITTSFYPLYFFTKAIVGDRSDVYNLTPAGAEPHDYELTVRDRARIEDSNLLIINGGKLESWGDKITTALAGSKTKALAVGDGGLDPHIWLVPRLATNQAGLILGALAGADSTAVDYFNDRYISLQKKFSDLDSRYRATLTNCRKKDIITTHSAFGRLAKEYGFNQIGLAGLSPDEEPSPGKLIEVADFARKNNVKYIFFETLTSPKLAETIAREVGAQTLVLDPLEGMSAEAIAKGEDYFTVMEKNLANLRIALACP